MGRKLYYRYLPASRMDGPFELTRDELGGLDGPGIYFLGALAQAGGFVVCYVGRAEILSQRLHQWIGRRDVFWYRSTESVNGSYFAECEEFHRYGKTLHLDNRIHPARPPYSRLPLCSRKGCLGEDC